jgi:MFS-type transporter involved in bile tolerance (Atg22 family)
LLFIGLGSGIIVAICYYYDDLTPISILMIIPVFLIENIRKPIGVAVVADSTNKNVLASVLSVQSQIQTLFIIIATPVLGYFSDKYGLGMGLIITTSIFIICGFILRIKKYQ